MDPLDTVKPWKDTTYFLMLACIEKNYAVCYLDQSSLWLKHDQLHARVQWVYIKDDHDQPFTVSKESNIALSETDVVWLRINPPFNRRYFYTTLLLDYLPKTTTIVNRPAGVRNWNEKLAALVYPEYTPRTLVTDKVDDIKRFAERYGRVTVKPIDGFGGQGILFYQFGEDDTRLKQSTHQGTHWVIAQEYLEASSQGDKRVLLLYGEPLGAILRLHAEGEELNNLNAGGTAYSVDLHAKDLEICAAMKQGLIEQGIIFAGIDIIGGKLIEVNVTSPTGLQELSRFSGEDFHHRIIEALEGNSG